MSDLIDRQAAIEAARDWYEGLICGSFKGLEKRLRALPPAQPKRGKWISADAIFGGVPFYCSECGENTLDTVMGKPRWNYCPNCGAMMKGENSESN